MRILFCTKNDIFGALVLNSILPRLRGHEVRVLLSDKTRPTENSLPELAEEKFLERDLPIGMLFPLLDSQDKHGECLTMQGVARKFNVPVDIALTINDVATEKSLVEWAPELIVSARFSLIFKQNILQIPRFGAYNIHPGALPGFAGLFAPMRALMSQEATLGSTLHKIDTGIDTGPVYSISHFPAEPDRSVLWHIEKLYLLGLDSLMTLIDELEQGREPVLQQQDRTAFRYFGMPTAEDFSRFRQMGYRMVCYQTYRDLLQRFWPLEQSLPAWLPVESRQLLKRVDARADSMTTTS